MASRYLVGGLLGLGLVALSGGLAMAAVPARRENDPPANGGAAPLSTPAGTAYGLGRGYAWAADLVVDADGAPDAYGPIDSQARDYLANAGSSGNWWGVATDTGKPDGSPVLSGNFYISTTALVDSRFNRLDRRRYVDASRVPFLALGRDVLPAIGGKLGDLAVAVNLDSGAWSPAIVADIAPRGRWHEGSVELAVRLGGTGNAKRGGGLPRVGYVLFPGSSMGWPVAFEQSASALFAEWGGVDQLRKAVPDAA